MVSSSVPVWLPAATLAISAFLMLACSVVQSFPRVSWCLAAGRWTTPHRLPFAMGFLTGINVCPPFLTGMVVVLAIGSAAGGVAFFMAFFAATSLYLLPVLGVWPWLSHLRARSIGRWALGLAGVWYLAQAARLPWR